jgi:hypothetical protein
MSSFVHHKPTVWMALDRVENVFQDANARIWLRRSRVNIR